MKDILKPENITVRPARDWPEAKDEIAFCGVNCSACRDYVSGKCPGCRQTEWKEGNECLPVGCCREKGVSFCGECPVFPCEDMKEFYKEAESHEEAYLRMLSCRS